MPTIARFYGIKISIFQIQKDHNPPHLHAMYGDHDAEIDIVSGSLIRGDLPGTAKKMVREWVSLHREELVEMWESQIFRQLPPLE